MRIFQRDENGTPVDENGAPVIMREWVEDGVPMIEAPDSSGCYRKFTKDAWERTWLDWSESHSERMARLAEQARENERRHAEKMAEYEVAQDLHRLAVFEGMVEAEIKAAAALTDAAKHMSCELEEASEKYRIWKHNVHQAKSNVIEARKALATLAQRCMELLGKSYEV